MVCQWVFVNHWGQWFCLRFSSQGFQCQWLYQCFVHKQTKWFKFSLFVKKKKKKKRKKKVKWLLLKGPKGPDQPRHLKSKQSQEIKTFSKYQAWSYDQSKVQAWPLIRRTHQGQAVLLRFHQAWSLENVFISGLRSSQSCTSQLQLFTLSHTLKP